MSAAWRTDGTLRLRPRGSFALWKESVQGRSKPWHENEKGSVLKLGAAIAQLIQPVYDKSPEAAAAEAEYFAKTATHDLKDYLRGIHHLATFLKRSQGDVLNEQGRHQIATILKITQRMDTLIDGLLDQSRINRSDMSFETVDLDEVIDQVLQNFSQLLKERKIRVRRVACLGRAVCNAAHISDVFSNLIANAITYNDKSDKWIELGADPSQPKRYYVRDNGIGIVEEDKRTIFQVFHRLHGRGEYDGGAGIGLALAAKIVERQGGRIWVQSVPGEGSTFYFTLAPENSGN